MNNLERAIEILEEEHDPYLGPIDAPSLVYALNDADLIASHAQKEETNE